MGVPLVINTDSHSRAHLANMRCGVAAARRGWCEAKHIVNTLPVTEFLEFVRAPKPKRMALLRDGVRIGGH